MQSFQGKSVYKGIVMGPVVVLKKNDYQVKEYRIEECSANQPCSGGSKAFSGTASEAL